MGVGCGAKCATSTSRACEYYLVRLWSRAPAKVYDHLAAYAVVAEPIADDGSRSKTELCARLTAAQANPLAGR